MYCEIVQNCLKVLFPNQTIPVLPEGHWATTSGEIWVPVDHNEKQNSQLVFAVYSNLDILFGNDVESDFMTINLGMIYRLYPSFRGISL